MGYLNSPAIAHNLRRQELNSLKLTRCCLSRYVDDILLQEPSEDSVREDSHLVTPCLQHREWAIYLA